ncbi:hypothetical protein LCGC14_0955320 [marine sediment metagenome]|uniref:Uncharacterized protein n=1 Tax=marine sediment metagenome TaxID=412755 RepID=A0A0F9NKM5_9ZZZZ
MRWAWEAAKVAMVMLAGVGALTLATLAVLMWRLR